MATTKTGTGSKGEKENASRRERLLEGQRRLLSAQHRLFSRAHDAFATLQNEQQAFVDRWLDDARIPDEARELLDTWRVVSDQNRRQFKKAVDASFDALEDLLVRLGDEEEAPSDAPKRSSKKKTSASKKKAAAKKSSSKASKKKGSRKKTTTRGASSTKKKVKKKAAQRSKKS